MIIFSYWGYNFINSLITVSNLCFQDFVKRIIYYHASSKHIFIGIYAKGYVPCVPNVTIKYANQFYIMKSLKLDLKQRQVNNIILI